MKARLSDTRRALAKMPLLAAALAVAAAIVTPLDGASAGSEPDLGDEGLRAGALRPGGLVSALRANGAEIVQLGARGGLNGYLVMPAEGAGYSLYVTDNGHAVAGLLYGPDGMEITGAQLAAARPAAASAQRADAAPPVTVVPETLVPPTAAPAMTAHADSGSAGGPSSSASLARLFERSAAAFGFTLGARGLRPEGPLVVLLGDPTCSFSRSAAARLGRAALDGRLQLRVVPVAILGADAARRAVAIAANPEPARAWFEGGGPADTRAEGQTFGRKNGAERIARNNALLDEWGASAVPLIAWRTGVGAVGHRVGDIDDVDAWLRETLGPETLVPVTLRVGGTRAGEPRPRDPRVGDGHE